MFRFAHTEHKDPAHNQNYFCFLIFSPGCESWKINSINHAHPQVPVTGKLLPNLLVLETRTGGLLTNKVTSLAII